MIAVKSFIYGWLYEWALQVWHYAGQVLIRFGWTEEEADRVTEPLYQLSRRPQMWLLNVLVPEYRHHIANGRLISEKIV